MPDNYPDMLRQVMDNKSQSENWQRSAGYYTERQDWYNFYRSIPKKKPYKWMSNKFIPLTFAKVETAVSNLMGMFFSTNPWFEVRPRETGDNEQAKINQKLLEYQFDYINFRNEFEQWLRQLCILGTGVAKVVWDVKTENCTVWKPKFQQFNTPLGLNVGKGFEGYEPLEGDKTDYVGPIFIPCNLNDIFPDPTAIDIQDSWVIHRTFRSITHLRKMLQMYPEVYDKNILLLKDSDTVEKKNTSDDQDIANALQRANNGEVSRPTLTGTIEVLERWGMYDTGRKDESSSVSGTAYAGKQNIGPEPSVITVAAGKHIISARPNPFWHKRNPFIKSTLVPGFNEFYGVGIPEILEDVQNNVNEIVNQRNDNISLALNSPMKYKRGVGLKTQNIVLKPGALFGVDEDVDKALIPMTFENYTKDAFGHVSEMERYGDMATGIGNVFMGVPETSGGGTATEASIKRQSTSVRIAMYARNIECSAMKEIVKFFYQLNYQFIDEEQVVRVVGQKGYEWIRIDVDAVRREYDFVLTGVFSSEDKSQKLLRLIQAYNIMKGSPYIKEEAWIKKIIELSQITDFAEEMVYLGKEGEQVRAMQQQLAFQNQMNQAFPPQPGMEGEGGGMPGNMNNVVDNEVIGTPSMPPPTAPVAPGGRL